MASTGSSANSSVIQRIGDAMERVEAHPGFQEWLTTQTPKQGDHCVVNNSFAFHDVATKKAPLYLVKDFKSAQRLEATTRVLRTPSVQNSDFKRFPQQQPFAVTEVLGVAVPQQRKILGELVFSLIAHVRDDGEDEVPMTANKWLRLVRRPTAQALVALEGDAVVVNSTADNDTLWHALSVEVAAAGETVSRNFEGEFATALDRLREAASARLELPARGATISDGMLDRIVVALRTWRDEYATALKGHLSVPAGTASPHLNDVLRIAYAFAHESEVLLKLVVSVCDLKPIVLWMCIDKHFALSEALRHLPWTKARNKPSLENYASLIGDARNRAFHNVLPFGNALRFPIPSDAIKGAEIRMFSEYRSANYGNTLRFADKELADVMLGFTRAKQRPTPPTFWSRNADVMTATIEVIGATNDALKDLYAAH